jgi:hypothetical protein
MSGSELASGRSWSSGCRHGSRWRASSTGSGRCSTRQKPGKSRPGLDEAASALRRPRRPFGAAARAGKPARPRARGRHGGRGAELARPSPRTREPAEHAARRPRLRRRLVPRFAARARHHAAHPRKRKPGTGRSRDAQARQRWPIERANAWLHNQRRLTTRWERRPELYLAFAQLAAALILWRRLNDAF